MKIAHTLAFAFALSIGATAAGHGQSWTFDPNSPDAREGAALGRAAAESIGKTLDAAAKNLREQIRAQIREEIREEMANPRR